MTTRPTAPADPSGGQPLSRQEAKAVSRQRLLDAALNILDDEGEGALTTVRITKLAKLAQSTFYVHFADVDDLVQALIQDLASQRQARTRAARKVAREQPTIEQLRETFRVPLNEMLAHPRLLRLQLKSREDRTSALGAWSRELHEQNRLALVADLRAAGIPWADAADRRRAEMVADGLIALTEALSMGHLEGRYPDIEEMIDVLVRFSYGYLTMLSAGRRERWESVRGR